MANSSELANDTRVFEIKENMCIMERMRNLEKNLRAVANRRRLSILKYLKKNKSASVGEIAYEIDLSFKATSRHLRMLLAVDIVEKEQKALQAFYSLSSIQSPEIRKVLSML